MQASGSGAIRCRLIALGPIIELDHYIAIGLGDDQVEPIRDAV